MPSFAFWKNPKSNPSTAPPPAEDELLDGRNMPDAVVIKNLDLEKVEVLPVEEQEQAAGRETTNSEKEPEIPASTTHAPPVSSAPPNERDSAVYLSDNESVTSQLRPHTTTTNDVTESENYTYSKPLASTKAPPLQQRTDSIVRLRRPAELNLGTNPVADASKPRSELEKRYDLIRNSKTQSKAALRSPTELLQERLNLSSKKEKVEDKTRVFTPPRATENGCWLPGPGAQVDAFTSTSVRARTEAGNRPAWWCKFDKLVVFDAIEEGEDGETKIHTRTSKGLSIARRRGELESIVIPLDCAHCQEMLNRHEWTYDMRVCKRSVCWDCKERCKWELKEEKRLDEARISKSDGNRYRADSVLQDGQDQEEDMLQKVGIEHAQPASSTEAIGDIKERLGSRRAVE
ncbi:hypothetical protein DDE82_003411 [Stemphylium lycopersici]|uniref:Uncharacterized protein n=1 Tax=Stemphylium lycopersici TaxID=183478 RepID=A0A364N931_STELY|nr:hypothetical protein DDE82_003411 [Stemphylium lycopersici]RAR13663.1 hypothetical protein DDE83_002985 [Stemphylium lycopersici]